MPHETLFQAVADGNLSTFSEELKKLDIPDGPDRGKRIGELAKDGRTLATWAVKHDQIEVLARLIELGVPMPTNWSLGLRKIGPRLVNDAALLAALPILRAANENLTGQFQCPGLLHYFRSEGQLRPVRVPYRSDETMRSDKTMVISEAALTRRMAEVEQTKSRTGEPLHPFLGGKVTEQEWEQWRSMNRKESDPFTIWRMNAVAQVMLADGPVAEKAEQLKQAAKSDMPQFLAMMSAPQQGQPSSRAQQAGPVLST